MGFVRRTPFRLVSLLLAGGLFVSPVFAQEPPPQPVWQANDLPPPSAAMAPPAMPGPIVTNIPAEARITSQAVGAITADGVGISPADATLPALDTHVAIQEVIALPEALPSNTLRGLASRYLVQEWNLLPAKAGTEAVPGKLLAARMGALIAWGKTQEATDLAARVPANLLTDEIQWAATLNAFAQGKTESACAGANAGVAAQSNARWQLAVIDCHALAGRHAEAQLGLDMLEEQGQQPDALFRETIAALIQKKPLKRASIPAHPSLWDQILLVQAAAKAPLLETMSSFATPILMHLSGDGSTDAAVRKAAAETLAKRTLNVAPGEWLTPVRVAFPTGATPVQQHEAERAHAMLTVLNIPLDATAQAQWAARPPVAPTPVIPLVPEAMARMRAALQKKDPRGVILAASAALPPNLADAPDAGLVEIVQALQQIGLAQEARQFAAESIASIGAQIKPGTTGIVTPVELKPAMGNLERPAPGKNQPRARDVK